MINTAGVILQTFGTVFSQRVLSVLEKHKNDEITIETAKEFLFDMLEPTIDRGDMVYRFEHSVRVAENAKIIAMAEGFNEMDLVIAGLLHDVGYRECLKFEDFSIHQFISADIANEYLTSAGYPSERRFEMVKAISRHNLTDKLRERKDK